MKELQEQFISEARELIQQAVDDLIALERDGVAPERIEGVFRAFHTLKGAAGLVELPAMGLAMHAAEDLLAAVKAGRLSAAGAVMNAALACLDQVSHWVDAFEATGALPPDAGEAARATAERLRALRDQSFASTERSAGIGADLPAWIPGLIEGTGLSRSADLVAIEYEPHSGCFFHGEDPLGLMRQVPDLRAFQALARSPWPPLAGLDPYACQLRLRAVSGASRDVIAPIFRLVPDQVRLIDVPATAASREPDTGGADLVHAVAGEQARLLRTSGSGAEFAGRIGAAARVAANALRHGGRVEAAARIEAAGREALVAGNPEMLAAGIDAVLGETAPGAPAPAVAAPEGRAAGRVLRVDEAKVDALVNLASELIVLKNGLSHLAREVEAISGGQDVARLARREQEAIERLAGEMHGAILQLRMVPVAQVFRTFPRLVRDMAQRLDKQVELVTRGETAECDKTIVDRLSEPLLHLVRNALDHGVESRDRRRAAGKPEIAILTLQASRVGDRLLVEVGDDGAGIDPGKVRQRARERSLLPDDQLEALSDEQALDLIFAAGFSTKATVSDISGRGVGMDVVRSAVEQMGGRVSVTSRPGAGTTVRLDLPMTIAVSRIMVVEAAGQRFGMPMDAITETVRLTPDRTSEIKGNEGFVLRDRVVPICALAELMNLPARPEARPDVRLLVVAESAGKVAALEVDAIRDRLDVVLKPMQGVLANARGYAGTTLLGDGSVLLVLNMKEILP